ncbi:putative peptidoglycan lipid II flippase [Actinopolymorpha cephalotaxi]|uniref:Peptidoglycan lipid II flippase n=1 Tax=Actinopolymorpha cephalotaxi TaxID=504797 RepID=A0A1I2UH05_9ACTN|nr:protein kinase family protein [Actinopolymorpha cephalotaxi]NYH86587.1 putative peptidoglycan lipid II flippase [Actinopolymorpha cephalotaxi]SFG76340.1 putative peptidoglycan lipid II flippase [Actinopolymorpha cephalotaxi]
MHPTDVDPGVTLAGRYRVAELLAETPGDGGVAQTWRAIDEVLSRSVVVHVLAADDPRVDHLLEASRRAATAADVRFIRVLDALRDDGVAYVVREWVAGRSLGALLADGPLPPQQAGLLVREVSEAIARAHDQGLAHERLDPDTVVVTDTGSIKIVGLATQAALSGARTDEETGTDPQREDAVGLGRLLYAGLTARWPAGPRSGLNAAPRAADGTLLSPRQCRAGVPRALDEITERILDEHPRHGDPLTTPQQIAAALTEVVGMTPIEGVLPPAPAAGDGHDSGHHAGGHSSLNYADAPTQVGAPPVRASRGDLNGRAPTHTQHVGNSGDGGGLGDQTQRVAAADLGHTSHTPMRPRGNYAPTPPPSQAPHHYPDYPEHEDGQRPRWWRIAAALVALLVLAGAGLLGYQLMSAAFDNPGPTTTPSAGGSPTPTKTKTAAAGSPVRITGAGDFDPPPGGNGEEHPEDVGKAHDGDQSTLWTTMSYRNNPQLGGLKPGVGMWFDLGKPVDVGRVELSLRSGGTDVQLRAAPEGASSAPTSIDDWQEIAKQDGAGGEVTLRPDKPVRTRFLLVWLTKLPPDGSEYRGGIAEIVVRR